MGRILLTFIVLTGLAACGDPLRDVSRLSDVQLAEDAGTAGVAVAPQEAQRREGGLFSRLLNRQPEDPTDAAVAAALADVEALSEGSEQASGDDVVETPDETPEVAEETGGLFGIFRRNRASASESDATVPAGTEITGGDSAEATGQPAAASEMQPAAASEVVVEPRRAGFGLFRRRPVESENYTGPDALIVEAGTVMPFGEIARVCEMRDVRVGRHIASVSGYEVYDTIPNSTAARPFYLTGFRDNCARTFTAAVVVPSDIRTHEFVRYQASNERIAYTEADNAYEAIKASGCRVGRGQPCGERTERLSRNTHFLSVYATFGSANTTWGQILLHGGRVIAMDIKSGE